MIDSPIPIRSGVALTSTYEKIAAVMVAIGSFEEQFNVYIDPHMALAQKGRFRVDHHSDGEDTFVTIDDAQTRVRYSFVASLGKFVTVGRTNG